MKRIFLVVLDSFGIGEMPDAAEYGDQGSNTLRAASTGKVFDLKNMKKLGLFNIEGVTIGEKEVAPIGSYGRLTEKSKGKDTTIGHWEISGYISKNPLPTYPNGFPEEVLSAFRKATGREVLCNKPYSGTEVIKEFGEEHLKTGSLIVYTSADSVFQIAAHEDLVPIELLYKYCQMARDILQGEHGVGRVIARPFVGEPGAFTRTTNRHDFSLTPPETTALDQLKETGYDVIGVGKITDIFAEKGITKTIRTKGNAEGIEVLKNYMDEEFQGLCFVNLVDFDMLYGHRNDVEGYAKALTEFDQCIPYVLEHMKEEDIFMITADHGCDPSTPSTDHSREYVPFLMYQKGRDGKNLYTRESFSDIGSTILDYFKIESKISGKSML